MILALEPHARAQTSQPAAVLDRYGSGACQVVLSEVGGGPMGQDLVYAGCGSALRVLDTVSTPPALVSGLFENPAELHGMVRDLDLVRGNSLDRIYAAAGPNGLVAYDLSSGAVGASAFVTSATAVAALDVNTGSGLRRIVFVAESIEPSGATSRAGTSYSGSVHVFRHTATRSALQAIDIGGSVYTCSLGGFPAVFAVEPAGTFGSASVTPTYYRSPMQPVSIRAFNTSAGLIKLLADARGGLHHLQ